MRAATLVLLAAFLALPTAARTVGPAAGPHARPAPEAHTVEAPDVEALLAAARKREARGDLEPARDAWLAAAPLLPIGAARDAAVGAARAIEDRLALRAEIAAYAAAVPGAFDALGVGAATATTLVVAGEELPWVEVDIELLRRAAKIARLSAGAQRGVVQEALVRGTPSEKLAALKDLARIHEQRAWPPTDVFAAVARARGEDYPDGGYVLVQGVWRRAADVARSAASSALESAVLALEEAQPKARDAALAKLEARGAEGVARATLVLEARWRAALAALGRGTSLEQLARIAEQREDLDRRRTAALELIFDQERYFYPYNPPACPPERAKLYASVQQEVNRRVDAVGEPWSTPRRARTSAAFRAALEELSWNRAAQAERRLEFAWDPALPSWILALDPAREVVDLTTFAWDPREAAALARDREVVEQNEALWKQGQFDAASAANAEEQEQVRVTNRYRALLGRRALAWNPRIQAAAQGHADYMSRTGDFGHFEPDPTRHGPAERLKLAGYAGGGSENCHLGDSGAEGAHLGWTHSSGHHRNLLEANHQEMASAIAGPYWCQNFGAGTR